MVTSWLSMEVPMFPSKAVPLWCDWSLNEPLIRRDGPNVNACKGGRTVTSSRCRNMPFHEPDHLSQPCVARTRQAADGPVGAAGDSSSVLEGATRAGSIVQPELVPRRGPDSFGLLSVMDRTYCQPRLRTRMASGFVRTSSTIIFSRSGKSRPALDQRARMRLRPHCLCAADGAVVVIPHKYIRLTAAPCRALALKPPNVNLVMWAHGNAYAIYPTFAPPQEKKHRAFPLSA